MILETSASGITLCLEELRVCNGWEGFSSMFYILNSCHKTLFNGNKAQITTFECTLHLRDTDYIFNEKKSKNNAKLSQSSIA